MQDSEQAAREWPMECQQRIENERGPVGTGPRSNRISDPVDIDEHGETIELEEREGIPYEEDEDNAKQEIAFKGDRINCTCRGKL